MQTKYSCFLAVFFFFKSRLLDRRKPGGGRAAASTTLSFVITRLPLLRYSLYFTCTLITISRIYILNVGFITPRSMSLCAKNRLCFVTVPFLLYIFNHHLLPNRLANGPQTLHTWSLGEAFSDLLGVVIY
jgi:hypothetical protein